MKILNLQAGIGGNIELIDDMQNEITNVELELEIAEILIKRKPNQKVIIGDANQYLLDHSDQFDFIWASPPCQTHSRMMKATRHKKKRFSDMTIYQYHIFLSHFYKGKWVIENVKPYYEPLIRPSAIIGRHYFWSNFSIDTSFVPPKQPKGFITKGTVSATNDLKEWLGIHYDGNIYYKDNHCPGQILRNAVHPLLGKHVFDCSLNMVPAKKELTLTLF